MGWEISEKHPTLVEVDCNFIVAFSVYVQPLNEKNWRENEIDIWFDLNFKRVGNFHPLKDVGCGCGWKFKLFNLAV